MRPVHALIDEALQELGGGDRTGPALTGVLHVGDVAVDHSIIVGAHRQPPNRLAHRGSSLTQRPRQLVAVAEQPGRVLTKAIMIAPVRVARSTMVEGL